MINAYTFNDSKKTQNWIFKVTRYGFKHTQHWKWLMQATQKRQTIKMTTRKKENHGKFSCILNAVNKVAVHEYDSNGSKKPSKRKRRSRRENKNWITTQKKTSATRTTAGKITINLNVPVYALNWSSNSTGRMLNPDVVIYHNDVIFFYSQPFAFSV